MSLISNSVTVVSVGSSEPAWFSSLAERTWTDIAGGTAYSGAAWQKGSRLSDVAPSPAVSGGSGQIGIIRAYNGAAVLQGLGEYLKIAEGGHNDYYGNEIYALGLKTETPGWVRIWGPTPNASITTGSITYNQAAVRYADNAPKSAHGWFNRIATEGANDNRLWTLLTNAGPGGQWTSDVWSIPRSSLGSGVIDPTLWVYHGRIFSDVSGFGSSFLYQSSPCAFDSTGNAIMVAPEADVRPTGTGLLCRRIDVSTCMSAGMQAYTGPQTPGTTSYLATAGNPATGFANGWSVVTQNTSPRCWICACPSLGVLKVWNLDSPSVFRTKTLTGGTLPSGGSVNGCYHSANRKIVLGGANLATLQTITIPTDPWNASSFAMGTITNVSGTPGAVSGLAGTFSQFQMIEDMGNGQACVVMHTRDVTQPTYVYKLPATF